MDSREELVRRVTDQAIRISELEVAVARKEDVILKLFAQCNKQAINKHKAQAIREVLEEHRLIMSDTLIFRFERWIEADDIEDYADNLGGKGDDK